MSRNRLTRLALPAINRRAALASGAALLLCRPALAATDFNTAIGWRSAAAGLDEARRTFRPVLMVVHADWCPACRTYARVFRDPAVVGMLGNFVPVLIDVDRDEVARRYQPDGRYIPRTMVLSSEGELFRDVTGPFEHRWFLPPDSPDYLVDFLERGLARAGGAEVELADPVRKSVPSGGGPSLERPRLGASRVGAEPRADGSGPKRLRAPGAKPAPAQTAETASTFGDVPQPGLIERLLGGFD